MVRIILRRNQRRLKPRTGRWNRLDVDRWCAGLVRLIRHPQTVRGEHGVGWLSRRSDGIERPARSILVRIHPQRHFRSRRDREQKVALRRPRLGKVCRALFGRRETLGGAHAVRALRVDRESALTVRLEREPLSVGRPHRHAVPAAERKAAQLSGAREIVDPDIRFVAAVHFHRELSAVRGQTRINVRRPRKFQEIDFAASIDQPKVLLDSVPGTYTREPVAETA